MLLNKMFQASEKKQNADRPDVYVRFYQETNRKRKQLFEKMTLAKSLNIFKKSL